MLSQFAAPLALLLVAAAGWAAVSGSARLAVAIPAVIALNAESAFFQERHAEHAGTALAAHPTAHARILRDREALTVPASTLGPAR